MAPPSQELESPANPGRFTALCANSSLQAWRTYELVQTTEWFCVLRDAIHLPSSATRILRARTTEGRDCALAPAQERALIATDNFLLNALSPEDVELLA